MSSYVLGFQDIDKAKIKVVGGKGASLGELSRIEGIHVPDGFCISTIAFKRVIEETPSIHELLDQLSFLKVDDRHKIHELSSEIRKVIEGIAIPEGYCRYALSYRDLEEMMQEHGMGVDHSTINRWVLRYAPELDKRIRPYLKPTNDSWRVDETYIKIRGVWKYLYRAVDSQGNTLDFMLSAKRDGKAAAQFFPKVLKGQHTGSPRVITMDKNAAYPVAMEALKADETIEK